MNIRCSECHAVREGDLGADGYDFCDDCRARAAEMTKAAPALRELLDRIERGEVALTAIDDPLDVFAGNVEYEAATGHRIVVFNDCNSFDYIDSIRAPDGQLLWNYPDGRLRSYDPVAYYGPADKATSRRIYGFPDV